MKYLRQIAVLIISAVFVIAVAIGVCVIFSLRNVNITYVNYGSESAEKTIAEVKSKVLGKFQGSVISFIDENEIKDCVGDDFVVESCEKVMPCTLNVKIKERRETYAVKDAENYKMYDGEGKYLKTSTENINASDNSPNVLLSGIENQGDIERLAGMGEAFVPHFSALRPAVSEIEFVKAQSAYDENRYIFYLRCGLTIEVSGDTFISEKFEKSAEVFSGLTGEQKLSGKIYCFTMMDSTVRATYNPNV